MPITSRQDETQWDVGLAGDIDVSSAADLKRLLIEAISSGRDVRLDLCAAADLDILALQLLGAARQEAAKVQTQFAVTGSIPDHLAKISEEAGFESFPVQIRSVNCLSANSLSAKSRPVSCLVDHATFATSVAVPAENAK